MRQQLIKLRQCIDDLDIESRSFLNNYLLLEDSMGMEYRSHSKGDYALHYSVYFT